MKYFSFQLIAMMCLLSMCKSPLKVDRSINVVSISVEQDGKLILPNKGVLALEKKEFNLIIDLPKPMAVIVNASFNDELYQSVSGGNPLVNRSAFYSANMMAVSLFNAEQTIYMAENASSPWFYESEEEHNFSKIELNENRYRCTRTIKQLSHIDAPESVNVKDIDDPVYLVFAPEIIIADSSNSSSFQAKYLKIEWNEGSQQMSVDSNLVEQLIVDASEIIPEDPSSKSPVPFQQEESEYSPLINNVIEELKLDKSNIKSELVISKVRPDSPHETIIVIPEIAYEVEYDLKFNSYIIIANNETGEITHKYFESLAWASDAIILSEIKIDTAPYNISENNQAFGIRVYYHTRSQPNPYSNSTISLFIKSKDTLKEILKNYDVIDYSAEWDMHCAGESIGHKKSLHMTTNKTNGYNDVLVKNEITETTSYEDENGDCESKDVVTNEETILKFNGEAYKEKETFVPMDVYLIDFDEDGIPVRQEPNGKIILNLEKMDDYFTLTITKAKEGWFKVINVEGIENGTIEISGGEGWIHSSDLEVSTRKKIELLDAPENGVVLGSIDQEVGVQVKDKVLNWVQIEYEGLTGWIELQWLCGNPVTTCP